MNYKKALVVAVVIVVIAVIAFTQKEEVGSEFKIGYFGPFTGLLANSTGESVADGFKLAESQKNTANGNTVKVIYEDDSCDPKKAVSAAQKLIEVDKVNILVSGVCSSATLAVAPIAEAKKVILISPTSASPKITTAGDYVFRLSSPTDNMVVPVITDMQKKGYKNIAVLYENNEYPSGWKDSFVRAWSGRSMIEVVAPGVTDVKTQLLKLQAIKPDAYLFLTISPSVATAILKQSHELGIKAPVYGNDTFSTKVVRIPESEGVITETYNYDLSDPKMISFLAAYKDKFNREAKEEIYAALGYDTYNALFAAIEACSGTNSECVKQELYNLKNVNGMSGVYSMDSNGDTQRSFVIKKIQGGQLVKVD